MEHCPVVLCSGLRLALGLGVVCETWAGAEEGHAEEVGFAIGFEFGEERWDVLFRADGVAGHYGCLVYDFEAQRGGVCGVEEDGVAGVEQGHVRDLAVFGG